LGGASPPHSAHRTRAVLSVKVNLISKLIRSHLIVAREELQREKGADGVD
jgi:hypothetical protein